MLLDYLAHDWLVQTVFLLVIGGAYCVTLVRGHITRENDATRLENRQKDLMDFQRQVGRSNAQTVKDKN